MSIDLVMGITGTTESYSIKLRQLLPESCFIKLLKQSILWKIYFSKLRELRETYFIKLPELRILWKAILLSYVIIGF